MVQRCTNPKHPKWKNYGGRGIKVCDRWLQFVNFSTDMGVRPAGTTLDRMDGSKGYEPGNCRWATNEEQHNNKMRCRYVEYNGARMSISQLGRKVGVYPEKLAIRLRRGWSLERAIRP